MKKHQYITIILLAFSLIAIQAYGATTIVFANDILKNEWTIEHIIAVEDMTEASLINDSTTAIQFRENTYVPARILAEQFHMLIDYDATKKELILSHNNIEMRFTLNGGNALILTPQNVQVAQQAGCLIANKAYVPLRFTAETLDLTVVYNDSTRTIKLSGVLNQIRERFGYSLNDDAHYVMKAVERYNQAQRIQLDSNQNDHLTAVIQREDNTIITDITTTEKHYRTYTTHTWRSEDNSYMGSYGMSEIIDGEENFIRLITPDLYFNLGALGLTEYECYLITDIKKFSVEQGTRYDIAVNGGTWYLTLILDQNDDIVRYIQYATDGTVRDDFNVNFLR